MMKRFRAAREGFTLIELMVVVCLIGIMVALAVPSMSGAQKDRKVYEHASSIAQLVRNARARAMGRGGSVIVQFSNAGSTPRGQFLVYEAVTTNNSLTTADTDGSVGNRTPDTRCKRGNIDLSDGNNVLVESVSLDGGEEAASDILSMVLNPAGTGAPSGNVASLCFSPSGRTYYIEGPTVNFDAALPTMSAFSVVVRRRNSAGGATSPDFGLRRRVIVNPNGITRIITGPKLSTDPS